mgnify:CR=1 FL=1
MSLPPVSVLLEPVRCMPAWVSRYLGYPTTTVASGYKVNADGTVTEYVDKHKLDARTRDRMTRARILNEIRPKLKPWQLSVQSIVRKKKEKYNGED